MSAENKKNEEFNFITEKIKSGPVDKKKIAIKTLVFMGRATVFGIIACFAFVLVMPLAEELFGQKEAAAITIPKDDEAAEAADPDENSQNEEEWDTPLVQDTQIMPLKEYENICSELYAVAEKANEFMVTVTAVNSDVDWFNNTYESQNQISGTIIGNNGLELLILTEEDAISGADKIKVTFVNKDTETAVLKKYDGNTGLAVIAVALSDLDSDTMGKIEIASLGNSYSMAQGNPVIALGSPLAYPNAVAYGFITSTKNTVSTLDCTYGIINTDIIGSSQGSGVLINTNGQVVGIIAQKYNTESSRNTIVSLSVSEVKTIIEKLSNNTEIVYLGIKGAEVTADIAAEHGLQKGVYVTETALDSPAMAVGIQNGDIITSMAGKPVSTLREFQARLMNFTPGQVTGIKVMRKGIDGYKEIEFLVTLGNLK